MSQVQSVRSAVRIMELLGEESPLGVSEVARRLELPKASVFRIINTLAASGWVEEDYPDSRHWRVATTFASSFTRSSMTFSEAAQQAVNTVRDETGETTHVLVPSSHSLMIVYRAESRQHLKTSLPIGTRVPLDASSSGAVYLASLPAAERRRILTDPQSLLEFPDDTGPLEKNIAATHEKGFATTQGRWRAEIGGVAAPIIGSAGDPVGTIAISYPLSRLKSFSPEKAGELLVRHAKAITHSV